MRPVSIFLALALFGASLQAQVHLIIKRDGRKVISNFGAASSAHGSDWRWWAKQRDRRSSYDSFIDRYAAQYGVDPVFVRAVIQVESDFNPRCVSNKGARGLMQLMPETARQYGVRNVFDPEDNIRGGVHNLADLLARHRGDLRRVLAAYNAGDGAVARYRGIPPYEETMTYVKRALTVYYGSPYESSQVASFAAAYRGRKLTGGFGASVQPIVAMLPGMRYLGTR
ncbi:MAG TPA: lytic transglycosylase domain-containing protein [Thermoanaerobaculia bacterium]